MPLLELSQTGEDTLLGLWQIEEKEDWFLEQLGLSLTELTEFQAIQVQSRKLEWLATRHLVKILAWKQGINFQFHKDGFGKPWLLNSGKFISVSHSAGLCAAILASEPCGTDIQRLEPKIEGLAPRFMSSGELESLDNSGLLTNIHVFWGAKEALFKAYGRKSLDFRQEIFIDPFQFNAEGGSCTGSIRKQDFHATYHIGYRILNSFIWVNAVQTQLISGAP